MTDQSGPPAPRGTILVVDDQEPVCEGLRSKLEGAGFTALTARSGRTGVALLRQHASDIRAVLLDLRLPGEDTSTVYDEMRRLRPDLPVILITSIPEALARAELGRPDLAGFLQKPFDRVTFLRTLRAALEGMGNAPPRRWG
ncbi:MAG TPA: response regulator [Candidatus Methylomirabilis sp.]|nr:response regulator [Candidatus Methylomirabilis sp.]